MGENTSIQWATHTFPTGRALGALKSAAKKTGLALDDYVTRRASGEKWCSRCKAWHGVAAFGIDKTRGDGLSADCLASGRRPPRTAPRTAAVNPETGRPGPAPNPARAGDARQARQRINVEVRTGRRPHPNELPCADCAHVYVEGGKRHEYDHYLGYAAEHHLDVEPVCTRCHRRREDARGKYEHRRADDGRFAEHEVVRG